MKINQTPKGGYDATRWKLFQPPRFPYPLNEHDLREPGRASLHAIFGIGMAMRYT